MRLCSETARRPGRMGALERGGLRLQRDRRGERGAPPGFGDDAREVGVVWHVMSAVRRARSLPPPRKHLNGFRMAVMATRGAAPSRSPQESN